MGIQSLKFDFKNRNNITLSGRLEKPETPPLAFAVFAHCFTCSKNLSAATRVSRTLSGLGIATLRFDFTGLGNSEGDFANTNFASNLDDLEDAYLALSKEFTCPGLLVGHSLGGAAVLKASTLLTNVKAVATIGAPSDVGHLTHMFKNKLEEISTTGEAAVNLAGREFRIKKQFIDDICEQKVLEGLSQAKGTSFLIMHSPQDETVSIDHAASIYGALKHPKSFVSLDRMDHLVTKAEDSMYIAEVIGAWVKRYL